MTFKTGQEELFTNASRFEKDLARVLIVLNLQFVRTDCLEHVQNILERMLMFLKTFENYEEP
jgi:hypothetical protein